MRCNESRTNMALWADIDHLAALALTGLLLLVARSRLPSEPNATTASKGLTRGVRLRMLVGCIRSECPSAKIILQGPLDAGRHPRGPFYDPNGFPSWKIFLHRMDPRSFAKTTEPTLVADHGALVDVQQGILDG
ncbi:hypothetical protein LZ31DRAFT_121607 [Colletotrichum somersetense]|nr:hypothetical protein LZ31DRAFT_121607 [Colletotrichum somersetense]